MTRCEDRTEMSAPAAGRKAMLYAAVLAILPLVSAWPVLGHHFWCEDAGMLAAAGRYLAAPADLFALVGRDFMPVYNMTFLLQAALCGASPAAAHLVDLLLQLLCGVLLAGLFGRLLCDPLPAALAALAWMLSRHTDETLFWMAARGHTLSFLCGLVAWLLVERGRSGLAAVAVLAAIGSKEIGVLWPALVTLRWLIMPSPAQPRIATALRRTAPLWLALAAYGLLRVLLAFQGHTAAYSADQEPIVWLRKGGYLVVSFLELGFLDWTSPLVLVLAGLCLALLALARDAAVRLGLAWMLVSLLPVLPLDKLTPRYELYPYAGFLLAVAALVRRAGAARPRLYRALGVPLFTLFMLYQAFGVYLDEKDYAMRSEYVRRLQSDYAAIADRIPDGPLAVRPVSGVNLQPVINRRLLRPKLIAPLPDALCGILPAEYLIGMAERDRGRAWLDAAPCPGETLLEHTPDGFRLGSWSAGDTGGLRFGRLVRVPRPLFCPARE